MGPAESLWPLGAGAKVLLTLFLAALAVGAIFSYQSLEGLRTSSDWVTHTLLVRGVSERLISRLQDAESAELGYLLSADASFRAVVGNELTSSRQSVVRLRLLTQDDPAQQGRVNALAAAVEARFAELQTTMDADALGDRQAAVAGMTATHKKRPMEDIRLRIHDIEAAERSLLSVRTQRAGDAFVLVVAVGAATLSSLVLLLALLLRSARRAFLERRQLEYAVNEERGRTERALRESYDRLREAARRKDAFLAILAHELRNPLAPIRNAARILKSVTDQREWAAALIERQVRTMATLLDELLDVSRISRGAFTLHPRRVSLEAVARHALETVQPGIDARGHLVALTVGEPIELDCDPVRIEQVLANLLTNAAKYSAPGSHITLTGSIEAGRACIRVSDAGIGFESVSADRLFEMFSQIGDPIERSEGGLGVGLALAKAIVELHHGSIEAHSEGLGKGSEFIVRLPLPQGPLSALPAGAQLPAVRRRVLVADDNRDGADSLAAALKLSGHEVMVTYDGCAALDAGAGFAPEIALIDIGMPGLNGYEVARAARATQWGKSMTLAALTGWGQEEDKRRALEAGFDVHLTKPVDHGVLEDLLAEPARQARNGIEPAPVERDGCGV